MCISFSLHLLLPVFLEQHCSTSQRQVKARYTLWVLADKDLPRSNTPVHFAVVLSVLKVSRIHSVLLLCVRLSFSRSFFFGDKNQEYFFPRLLLFISSFIVRSIFVYFFAHLLYYISILFTFVLFVLLFLYIFTIIFLRLTKIETKNESKFYFVAIFLFEFLSHF